MTLEEMQNSCDYANTWTNDIGAKTISCEEDIRLWCNEVNVKLIEHAKGYRGRGPRKPLNLNWGPVMIFDFEKRYISYKNGLAVFTGKITGNNNTAYTGTYLTCIDIGNEIGLKEILSLFKVNTLEELAKSTIVERYMENEEIKYHIFIITNPPLIKRRSYKVKDDKYKDEIPRMEIKSDEKTIVFVAPSIDKNGRSYESLGTRKLICLTGKEVLDLEEALNRIYRKYLFTKYAFIERCKPSDFIYYH